MTVSDFFAYLKPGKKAHLVGIGGVSMSPLAEVFKLRGLKVQGSDINDSDTVKGLRADGIPVFIGHRPENVAGADFVVRTAAVHDDNPEIRAAHEAGIPVFERTQAWGAIMKDYACGICVAGTHGKTTTTSMLTHILLEAGKDPTVMIGGTLPIIGSGYRVGKGDTILLESCEYYDSFLNFSPTVAVILNVDNDHLDYFGTLDNIKKSFRAFAELTPEKEGWVISCADDANTEDTLAGLHRRQLRFGFRPEADMRPEGLTEGRVSEFDAVFRGEVWAHITLRVCGRHNILNALAACAAAYALGLDPGAVERGLASFRGAGRRAEFKGSFHGADVYDDYAHHPSEVKALIEGMRTMGYKRIVTAYQPFTFSRAATLFDKFVDALSTADVTVMCEIHPARETNTYGISSKDIAAKIPGCVYFDTVPEVAEYLRSVARPGDAILTTGGGPIVKAGEAICEAEG